jgi:hypothetical protein
LTGEKGNDRSVSLLQFFLSFSVIAIFVICKLFLLPQNRKYWPFQPPACPQLDYFFQPQPLICDLPTVGKKLNQKVKQDATSHQKVNTVVVSVCLTLVGSDRFPPCMQNYYHPIKKRVFFYISKKKGLKERVGQ